MSRSTIRTAALGLAAAAAAVTGLATAPAATATPSTIHYQESWTTVSGSPGQYVSGVAHCPSGTVVVSGGAGNAVLTDLTPRANGTGYYAAGLITDAGPHYLAIEAVCAPKREFTKATTRTLTQRVHTGSDRFGSTLTCAAGTTAYSGGITLKPKSGTINDLSAHYGVTANVPGSSSRTWTLGATGDSDHYDASMSVRCVPNNHRSSVTVRKNYTATAAAPYRAAGYATCPAGYKPYAGGAFWSSPGHSIDANGVLTASYSTHQPDGWWASGPTPAPGAVLHVVAKCS